MRSLDGHSKDVRNVAFLPDGRLVSVGSDKTARLWDPRAGTGTVIHKGRGPLYAVAVSPDGRRIALGGRPGTPENPVTVYDVAAGKVSNVLNWDVEDEVYRWGTGQLALVRTVEPVNRSIWSLAFSADGRFLAMAGRRPGAANIPNGGGGCWWPTDTWTVGGQFPGDAYAVRFAPEGTTLAVTVQKGVWFYPAPDAASEPVTFPVQCDWAPAVDFLPGADTAAVAAGSYVHFVAPAGGRKPVKVKAGMRAVTALSVTPDGRALLVGGKPGRVEVYDVTGTAPRLRTAYDFEVGGVFGLAVSPDGLTFAVAGEKGLRVCDFDEG